MTRHAEGRLSLTSGTAITTSDVSSQTTLYYTPYNGNRIELYDGSAWSSLTFTERSILGTVTTNGNTTNGSAVVTGLADTSQFVVGMTVTGTGIPANATIASINSASQVTLSANATATNTGVSLTFKLADGVYDVFGFSNAGVLKLEFSRAWSNSFGTRLDAITTVDNIDVKSGATTRRLLGTVIANGGLFTDSRWKRWVSNRYNDVNRPMARHESAGSWTLANSSALRIANNNSDNTISFVACVPRAVTAVCGCHLSNSTADLNYGGVSISVDQASPPVPDIALGAFCTYSLTQYSYAEALYQGTPGIGYHYLAWCERPGTNPGTTTFWQSVGGFADNSKAGIVGNISN